MKLTYGAKKLLSVLSAISIAVCCLPFAAAAATTEIADSGECGEIKWSVEYVSYMGNVLTISPINETAVIPDFEDYGDNVSPWYKYRTKIEAVKIESGITRIGNYAFYRFSEIKYIDKYFVYSHIMIPSTVTSIGDYAFSKCQKLTNADLENNIKTIGEGAFSYCSIFSEVCLPTNLYAIDGTSEGEIPDYLFSGCSELSKVTMQQNKTANFVISSNINRIGKYAFSGCEKLRATNGNWLNVPNTIVTIDDYAFENCSSIEKISVTSGTNYISPSAFNGCISLKTFHIIYGGNSDYFYMPTNSELFNKEQTKFIRLMPAYSGTEYTFPDTALEMVREIGDYAFNSSMNLEKITIPDGVKSIGEEAFSDCEKLTEIYFPKSIEKIGYWALYGIKTQNVDVYYDGTAVDFEKFDVYFPSNITMHYSGVAVGDLHQDGKIDILDLIALKKAIAEKNERTDQNDINADGKLDAGDIVSLRKMILGL